MTNDFSDNDYAPIKLTNQTHPRIRVYPQYYKLGFSGVPHVYGRRAVLLRLLNVLELLPAEYGLLIWDVYRPREVQGALFTWMRNEIRKKNPQLSDEENYAETKKYMSPSSQRGDSYCPPHLSGGAIDLTLYDVATGIELEMGTAFDDCSEKADRDYFNQQINLSAAEVSIKKQRNLLRGLMEKAGFTSYQHEWWHFDLGTIFWSKETGNAPLFGPLFGDEEWPSN
ncbi:M15 family metallopeptidase [Legionella lytica]|uniref:D-alanyl-D-alanine dipeptidase n=1 Tax=Legionella lytica TaxID=96232 RepID=A0ABW8DAH1_9GAMM